MAIPTSLSTQALVFDGSAHYRLKKTKLSLQRGDYRPDSSTESSIYLAAGFPSLVPECDIPFSVSLKLNADLGTFDHAFLQDLAGAELGRYTSTRFRTYIVSPDPGVIVIAAIKAKLHSFLNTYGGVLDIAPLLLHGYHPDYIAAEDVHIDCSQDGCTVTYKVKAPISSERCTYCGACGPACPENCLSETLFLDFSRCTSCQECVNACPENAIDLHAFEQRIVNAPALLSLDDIPLELPDKSTFFRENQLAKLFTTIGEYQVDEVINHKASICQYQPAHDAGCHLCATVCPADAISFTTDGLQIDQKRCTECGNCVAVCPTGALQYLRFNDQQFLDYMAEIDWNKINTVVVGSEKDMHSFWWHNKTSSYPDTFFLEYPNPLALTCMHLFALYQAGPNRLFILSAATVDNNTPFYAQRDLTNQLVAALDGQKEAVSTITVDELDSHLQKVYPAQPAKQTNLIQAGSNRRANLAAMLTTALSEEKTLPTPLEGPLFSTFGSIRCDTDKCTQCLACLSCCHIEALQADEEHFSLVVTSGLCVQCGACMALCPENALSSQNGLILDALFFTPRILSMAEPARCVDCGKIFGTQKSLDRVAELLSTKDDFDREILTRCETCRVIHIFEQGNQ